MKKGKKPIQRLLWIIDFINKDIGALSTGDFLKVLVEIRENIEHIPYNVFGDKGNRHLKILSPVFPEDAAEKRKYLKELQNRLKRFLEMILKVNEDSRRHKVPGDKSKMKDKLTWDDKEYTYAKKKGLRTILKENREACVMIADGGILVDEEPGEHSLEFELADLLYEALPAQENRVFASLDNIRRCQYPTCQNFFLQLHKKEKNYCSNRCAWRAYSKQRREMGRATG